MPSTFEILPNEILVIIFEYSGDARSVLRTFLGLNQRLTRILLDKHLHLLTDFLSIDIRHPFHSNYYNSVAFREISHELLAIHGSVDEQQLCQCLKSLVSFHIQEQYRRSGDELRCNLAMFETLRMRLTDKDIIDVDNELNQAFDNLKGRPINLNDIREIERLVLEKGARLECDDSEKSSFNLAIAIDRLLHAELNNINFYNEQFFKWITQMFKALICSNPSLLSNRTYYIYSGCNVWYFLFFAIYRTQYHPYYRGNINPVNIKCYQAVVNLLLFAIQCQRLQTNIGEWARKSLFYILDMIPAHESKDKYGIFITNTQWEVLKIIIDIYASIEVTLWEDNENNTFQLIFGDLATKNRADVIFLIYQHLQQVRHFFNQSSSCQFVVDKMIGNQIGRQSLQVLMDHQSFKTWMTSKDLVFILLQKKERKLLEKLLRLSPFLVHHLDEYGNDPLLYVCLKVRGCRHRLVKFLITMKANLQKRNFNGENFFDVIKLKSNQKLLEKLDIEKIIEINDRIKIN